MVKCKSVLKWLFILLVLLFIYFPILFLTVNSFNESDMIQSGWKGFSWSHYKYFFDFVGCKKPAIKHLSGYTSWYNYFQNSDEKIILRDLNGLNAAKKEVNIFQIDDGYEPFVGDWLDPCEKFPNGMKYIADKVHEKGYKAGIWIAPFSCQTVSRVAKEHPDWLIKDEKGKPTIGCIAWGGAYTLDIYNPEVREYIKHFFHLCRSP